MSVVHINNFYNCDKIDLACELFYVCELGKYLSYNNSMKLSLKGVKLDKVLLKSNIWFYLCLAIYESWVIEV